MWSMTTYLAYKPCYFKVSFAIASTCAVCGNISTGWIYSTWYLLLSVWMSLVNVDGLQDTYTNVCGLTFNTVWRKRSSQPVLGGSTTTTSGFQPFFSHFGSHSSAFPVTYVAWFTPWRAAFSLHQQSILQSRPCRESPKHRPQATTRWFQHRNKRQQLFLGQLEQPPSSLHCKVWLFAQGLIEKMFVLITQRKGRPVFLE